jgi:hypothetical protein
VELDGFRMGCDAGHEVATERPEALTNTIIDFLDPHETFSVGHRDSRINP